MGDGLVDGRIYVEGNTNKNIDLMKTGPCLMVGVHPGVGEVHGRRFVFILSFFNVITLSSSISSCHRHLTRRRAVLSEAIVITHLGAHLCFLQIVCIDTDIC